MPYIPKNILESKVDCCFFIREPFKAAAYNFRNCILRSNSQQEKKTDEVAKKTFDETQHTSKITLCGRIAHFFRHVVVGFILSLPLLNFFPFVVLALKAKEHKSAPEAIGIQAPSQKKEEMKEKINQKVPSNEPEDLFLKNRYRETIMNAPISADSPTTERQRKITNKQDEVCKLFYSLLLSEVPETDFQNTYLMSQKEGAKPITNETAKKLQVSKFLKGDEWLKFPAIKKSLKAIVENLITRASKSTETSNIQGPLVRYENAITNLNGLRKYLNNQFPEYKDAPLMETYKGDGKMTQNPYYMLRHGIFKLAPDEFEALFKKCQFRVEDGLFYINPHVSI